MIVYPDISSVKRRLSDLRDILPEIQGRNGELAYAKTVPIDVKPTATETIDALDVAPLLDPVFHNFAAYFIYAAFAVVEYKPVSMNAYCGVVGQSGQMLDYLHDDPVSLRLSTTAADNSCRVNPSTRVCPDAIYDFDLSQQIRGLMDTPTIELPELFFIEPVPEGGISQFVRNQAHAEKNLPMGTAKLALFATYKF